MIFFNFKNIFPRESGSYVDPWGQEQPGADFPEEANILERLVGYVVMPILAMMFIFLYPIFLIAHFIYEQKRAKDEWEKPYKEYET